MNALHDDIEIPVRFAGNGMTGGEGRYYDALAEANHAQLVEALSDREALRERLLHDPDTFSDWLCGECSKAPLQKLPRITLACAPEMEDRTTPQIVALLLYPRSDIQAAAMDELKARYLKRFGVPQ